MEDKLNEQEEIDVEGLNEDEDFLDIDNSKRAIFTEQGDPEIDSLYNKYKRGRLVIQPYFQRRFVWDKLTCSRLIESALLEIPLPVIYLAEEKDNSENVIDGQQRLTSFFSFIDGHFPDNGDFKLTGLQVFKELNNKSFQQLSDDIQDKIRYYKLRTIKFKKESDSNLRFEIFERLNKGSYSLNDQELRNCIYRGKFNDFIKELSNDEDFMYLLGLKQPEKRMKDVELVLRFVSFYLKTYLNYKPPVKKFLNSTMEDYNAISENKLKEIKVAFKNSVQIIRSLLDKNAFKRFYKGSEKAKDGYWEPNKFNASLYDILIYSFAREDKNTVYQNLDSIREALIFLMTEDQEFIDSIELSTSTQQAVTKRFDKWRIVLQDIIGVGKKETRCFSYQLKQELYNTDQTCSICGNKIQNIDDSAIDHIQQYWTGGQTIPENARLTHRYCNWSRSRKE